MTFKMNNLTVLIAMCIWNFIVICGTTYYVFKRDNSAWWFILCLLLLALPEDNCLQKSTEK